MSSLRVRLLEDVQARLSAGLLAARAVGPGWDVDRDETHTMPTESWVHLLAE